MTKTKTAERHGFTGQGRTLTEARDDLDRQIAEALAGTYAPELITHKGSAYLVYRTPCGWYGSIVATPAGFRASVQACSSTDTRERAIRQGRRHLAQLTWTIDDDPSADDLTHPLLTDDREGAREHQHWIRFQRRFARANEAGLEHSDAWQYAAEDSSHGSLADLTLRVEQPDIWQFNQTKEAQRQQQIGQQIEMIWNA